MADHLDDELAQELDLLKSRSRLRRCPSFQGPNQSALRTVDARTVHLSFSSNDYLGLAHHPALVAAAQNTLATEGVGAGASRLVSGDLAEHRALEEQLASFAHAEACLLFPTGYQANMGVLTALAGPDDLLVSDALNHASLIDGCRLSRATLKIYRHADVTDAAQALATPTQLSGKPFRRRLLVTESLFSMDGDVAPLSELFALTQKCNAVMIVDEAHALGTIGPQGRGLCTAAAITPSVRIGTLGKSFGTAGGFALVSRIVRTYLVNRARTFIYTTAPPPAIAAASLAALKLIKSDVGTERREALLSRGRELHLALGLNRPPTPIVPIILGSDEAALSGSTRLLEQGIYVQAIRPPTVPEGTSRLRVTLSSIHTAGDVHQLCEALSGLKPKNPA